MVALEFVVKLLSRSVDYQSRIGPTLIWVWRHSSSRELQGHRQTIPSDSSKLAVWCGQGTGGSTLNHDHAYPCVVAAGPTRHPDLPMTNGWVFREHSTPSNPASVGAAQVMEEREYCKVTRGRAGFNKNEPAWKEFGRCLIWGIN